MTTIDDRYALVETRAGALMLDLASGALLELNESGRIIWQQGLAGQSETAIATDLARRYGLDVDTARRHVRETLKTSGGVPANVRREAFSYERRADEYLFRFNGEDVFAVDERGDSLALRATPNGVSLPYLLQVVAPKLLALRGQTVMHASAVALRGRVVAFSGLSGAGKTTTARALADAGADFLCEDKLLLRVVETGTVVAAFGERVVNEWVASAAEELRASKSSTCAGLDLTMEGDTMPLAEIGFLDQERRARGPFVATPLSETETAAAVFRNAFYGSDANRDWIRHLRTAVHVGQTVRGFALTVPDGLEPLAESVGRLVSAGSLDQESERT